MQVLGYLGGTFDPVHCGHLRMAIELKEVLAFDRFYLVPCRKPPHRAEPLSSDRHRGAMVDKAIEHCTELSLDRRELERDRVSYSLDTLRDIRNDVGEEVSVSWCVGMDSLVNINAWHRWQELLHYAHLVVVTRPGWNLPESGEVADWVRQHQVGVDHLTKKVAGGLIIQSLSLLDISATDIRRRIQTGNSVQFLLPESVRAYIEQERLYK